MIGQLRGILLEKHAPTLVVEAGGIGYELQVPMTSFYQLPSIGKEVTLYTHLVVREDAQSLYGFVRKQERSLFRSLIKVNGVGPKLALTILSGVEADSFVKCVMDNDIASLVRLPGIGKKTAQRLLIEMRDPLKGWDTESCDTSVTGNTAINDAISALIALGYKQQEAHRAVIKHKDKNLSSEQLIRLALQGE
jgi:Holliday junction DNA helicase RuvA